MVRPPSLSVRRIQYSILAVIASALFTLPASAQFETRSTRSLPVIGGSFAIATGDFNNDGKLDVAVINGLNIDVSLGNGDGTFRIPVRVPTNLTYSLAVGDFNNDGNLDIAVADPTSNSADVFLGNGDGTFKPAIKSKTSASPAFVAVGDFNHDGKLDLAVINIPNISILLGKGDGSFLAPIDNQTFTTGPSDLVVTDFNHDGKLDVVVVGSEYESSAIGVLFGNGDGTLKSSITTPLGTTAYTVAVADLNRDGNLDAAIASNFDDFAVLLGDGTGSFGSAVYYNTIQGFGNIQAGDFNGDGTLDLALAGIASGQQGLSIFTGNGDGTFQAEEFYPAGKDISRGIVLGDFNGDHMIDIVVSDQDAGAIALLNTGVASFSPTTPLLFGDQLLNSVSAPQTVTLSNNGTKSMTISSITGSAQYVVTNTCGTSLAPGDRCQISTSFAPTSQGSQAGTVTIVDSASSKPQVIELLGAGTVVSFSPATLTFASQKVGTTSPKQKVQLTNTGKTSATFTDMAVHGFDFQDFAETNDCPSSLGAGSSCTITVTFTPTKTGSRTAFVYTYDSGGGSPQRLPLSGTGD